jgi:regulator of protease activity HflC (stomatin/prohibitin superfamily)
MTLRQQIGIGVAVVAVILLGVFSTQLVETVDSDEIMIIQDPVDGELHVYTDAGMHWQGFGKVTKYDKSNTLWFSKKGAACEKDTKAIKTRFNDGANGWVCGSLRYELPRDEKSMKELHRIFGSEEAMSAQLVNPVIQKSVYMSGPLMSSKESYAERRTDLIQFIKDQTENGVYKTRTETRRVAVNNLGIEGGTDTDANTKYKTIEVAVIATDGGMPIRQEVSPLTRFGVRVYNFSITGIRYDETVEKQIAKQQMETMEVQTSIAQAKKEEQRTRTEIARGKAEAEKSRWAQEVEKARAVTLAEQEKEVAITKAEKVKEVAALARDAAKLEKERQILLGEGEAKRKKLVMTADGALTQKLNAWKEVQFRYAAEIGKQRWVPNIVMGSSSGTTSGGSAAASLVELLTVKTAKDIQLDMSMNAK